MASEILYQHRIEYETEKMSDNQISFFAQNVPSEEVIDDKSKQDILAKTITSLQTFWTFIQIIARAQQGLPIPLLQIATLGYMSMAVFCYACWWFKPYDIGAPYALNAQSAVRDRNIQIDIHSWFPRYVEDPFPPRPKTPLGRFLQSLRKANDSAGSAFRCDIKEDRGFTSAKLGCLFIIFAAIHCASWSYAFPTLAEAWLWRGSVLGTMGPGILFLTASILDVPFSYLLPRWITRMLTGLSGPIAGISLVIYGVGRVYIMIECIIAFRKAPSGIYQQVNWSAYIPHVGA